MSQRQRLPESEAAAALELLTLREQLDELALNETRLKLQILELQSQIASYQASTPGKESARSAAQQWSGPLDHLVAWRAQLADAQEQQARLAAQKDELTSRQKAAQKRLSALRVGLQREATWQHAAPPWEKTNAPRRKRSQRPVVLLVSGLLLIVILASLIHFAHVSSLDLSQLASAPFSTTGKTVPPEAPPFYTPAKTAPTNQGCITTIKYECFSPQYIQQAMGLTELYKSGLTGKGQTIVLVGAGVINTLSNDLHQFDLAWGLPDPQLTILYPDGPPTPYTCADGDYLQYQNIRDVEWAHAIAPGANIILLIGSNHVSDTQPQDNCVLTSLQQDIAYALDNSLGSIISVDAGVSELGTTGTTTQKIDMQQYLTKGHQLLERAAAANVTVVAAAGDKGATNSNDYPQADNYWTAPNVSWPGSDPDALAVGGTTLRLGNSYYDDAYDSETAWSSPESGSTGGGLSAFFNEPDYQKTVPDQTIFQGKRGVPDVAFPATNLLIYNSGQDGALIKANPQWSHWDVADGTSVAAAAWAGLIALANQERGQPLGLVQPALYRLQGQGMHDITTGNNTYEDVTGYQAQKGYDLVSGWGTPFAQTLLPALLRADDDDTTDCGAQQSACP